MAPLGSDKPGALFRMALGSSSTGLPSLQQAPGLRIPHTPGIRPARTPVMRLGVPDCPPAASERAAHEDGLNHGNYGAQSSRANYLFRYRAFSGIGNMPGPIPNAYRPMSQELTPIHWGQRVKNTNISGTTTEQHGPITVQTKPSTWQGSNTASLTKTGEVLL